MGNDENSSMDNKEITDLVEARKEIEELKKKHYRLTKENEILKGYFKELLEVNYLLEEMVDYLKTKANL